MKCGAILVILVGIALPLSASAQDAQFSVYGTLLPFVDNFRTTGATPPGLSPETGGASQVFASDYTGENLPQPVPCHLRHIQHRLSGGNFGSTRASRPGSRSSAWRTLTATLSVYAAPWASRNSAVGLAGKFGTVFWGQWDTPYYFAAAVRRSDPGPQPFRQCCYRQSRLQHPGRHDTRWTSDRESGCGVHPPPGQQHSILDAHVARALCPVRGRTEREPHESKPHRARD